jgi:hypothetical protein
MSKHILIAIIMAGGLATCLFAPVAWRLIGVFCIGGGCYAIIETLKVVRIQHDIERYEQPAVDLRLGRRRGRVPVRIRVMEGQFRLMRSRQTLPDAAR